MASLRAWAIRRPTKRGKEELVRDTVSRTRAKAIKAWMKFWSPDTPKGKWAHWRRQGYRAVKVIVLERRL